MSWTTAVGNELAHERDVLASYLPWCRSDNAWSTLPGDLVGRVLRSGRAWEGWLIDYIRAYGSLDRTSIDVGANVGVHTRTMAAYSFETIALEPQVAAFDRLLANVTGLPNVRALRLAACARPGRAAMRHVSGNRGASRLVWSNGDEAVTTIRLDDLPLHRPVGLMKVDVEGHERQVLEGATRILATDRPAILLEDTTKARDMLKDFDYSVTRISWRDFLCLPRETVTADAKGRGNA